MLTLQILMGYFIFGTILSIILLKDGYIQHAKIMFVQLTLGPIGFILFLILAIGCAPLYR